MKSREKKERGQPFLDLVEESVHLVRMAPSRAFLLYYLGSAPFILMFLYFWSDMSFGAFAHRTCGRAALVVAASFVWMKCWQTAYMAFLSAFVRGVDPPRWTPRRMARVVAIQAFLQSIGVLALLSSIITMLPLGWVYAFFQNATLLGDGEEGGAGETIKRAWKQAMLWPRQNHFTIWLLSPLMVIIAVGLFQVVMPIMQFSAPEWTGMFIAAYAIIIALVLMPSCPVGMAVALNIALLIGSLPELARIFFGVESFAFAAGLAGSDVTFMVVVCALTYLVMDPIMKAAYVLRCFHGESLRTGEDLRVELRAVARRAARLLLLVAVAVLFAGAMPAAAQESAGSETHASPVVNPSVNHEYLDRSLDEVLERREYSWRMPRERVEEEKGVIGGFFESIRDTAAEVVRWLARAYQKIREFLEGLFPHRAKPNAPTGVFSGALRGTLWILLAGLIGILIYLLVQAWRRRGQDVAEVAAEAVAAMPDLEDENTLADELPEDGWLTLARELMAKGELRLALRALFLSSLSLLGQHELIRIAKYKSNRDYEMELRRRMHAQPEVLDAFAENTVAFERSWYGFHEVTRELFMLFERNQDRIRAHVQEK